MAVVGVVVLPEVVAVAAAAGDVEAVVGVVAAVAPPHPLPLEGLLVPLEGAPGLPLCPYVHCPFLSAPHRALT